MNLATACVSMDLEPEVPTADRERVMRALRDKLRSHLNHRITVRTDDDVSIFISLFDENLERAKSRLQDALDHVESTSEARIATQFTQIFTWFEGKFHEVRESLGEESYAESETVGMSRDSNPKFEEKMIVYGEEEDEGFSPIPTRFRRRLVRLPARK